MGDERKTVKSLSLIKVDFERNFILIRGSIPGAIGGDLVIMPPQGGKG
jgi:large subunit ribosomal protein L3